LLKNLLPLAAFSVLLLVPIGMQNAFAGGIDEVDVIFTKEVDKNLINPGELVTYTYTLENIDPVNFGFCSITDDKLGLITDAFSVPPLQVFTFEKSTNLFETTTNISTLECSRFSDTASVKVTVVPLCGDMYVVTGGGALGTNTNVDDGALALVDFPGTGDLTQIGPEIASQVVRKALSGMAFDLSGDLFVVASGGTTRGSILLKINPSDGQIITSIGEVNVQGTGLKVKDLAMHNGVLYGTGNGDLITIHLGTAEATVIGQSDPNLNGLTITPDGTFYATQSFLGGPLFTVDPISGDTTFVTDLDTSMDGLGSDDEGKIYGTETGPDSVHLINIIDGSDETVGAVGDNPSDVDFFPCPIVTPQPPVGGKIIPIESTSLILAGAQTFSWMIPVILSGIGIGLFVVSRKSENS